MSCALTSKDLSFMQMLGRYVARDNDTGALNLAAENYATATQEEKPRLYFHFLEGVRNYADSQDEVALHMKAMQHLAEEANR